MLQVVQGDILEVAINLNNTDKSTIEKVVFSCKNLSLSETAVMEEGEYRVRVESSRTQNFPQGFHRYDITVVFTDGERLTVKRHKIEVIKKLSKVSYD